MMPILPCMSPSEILHMVAGAALCAVSSVVSGVRSNLVEMTSIMSWAVTIAERSHWSRGPRGICSIKRSSTFSYSPNSASGRMSSSLTPGMITLLIFTGERSALMAASIPAITSLKRSRRVRSEKCSGLRVSREIFTRSRPASFSCVALRCNPMPLVVRAVLTDLPSSVWSCFTL